MSYFLFLAAFLAVAGIGYAIRNRAELLGKILMIGGAIGCAGLVVREILSTFAGSSGMDLDRYHATASYTLGTQVAREMTGQRGQIVLIYPPERATDPDVVNSLTYAFARAVQSTSLQLRQTNLAPALTLDAFEQTVPAASDEVAYIFLAGVPPGIEGLARFKQQPAPRLFVFDPAGSTDWLTALKKGVIRRVIVPRPDTRPAKGEEIAGRPEEIFPRYFLIATPETADQVAAQLRAKR